MIDYSLLNLRYAVDRPYNEFDRMVFVFTVPGHAGKAGACSKGGPLFCQSNAKIGQ
jgi:hypothetical protein